MHESERIRPELASDEVAFVGMMRQLKERSGRTFRQLEEIAQRNGDYLPRSTVADMLRRQTLPRPDVLAALVRACAGEEQAAAWLQARDRLVDATPPVADAKRGTAPLPPPAVSADRVREPGTDEQLPVTWKPLPWAPVAGRPSRRPYPALILAALVAALLVVVVVMVMVVGTTQSFDEIRLPPQTTAT